MIRVLHLDFSNLKAEGLYTSEFREHLLHEVRKKFNDTNIYITDRIENLNTDEYKFDIKTIEINKSTTLPDDTIFNDIDVDINPSIDDYQSGLLGGADDKINWGFVNLENIVRDANIQNFEHLVNSVSTVVTHEAGHLFLGNANGHSQEENIMADGERLMNYLKEDGGANLQFSDLQKSIISQNIEIPPELTLSDLEQNNYPISNINETSTDKDIRADLDIDISDII